MLSPASNSCSRDVRRRHGYNHSDSRIPTDRKQGPSTCATSRQQMTSDCIMVTAASDWARDLMHFLAIQSSSNQAAAALMP